MAIRPWEPVGEPEVLAKKFQRSLTLRTFRIPKSGTEEKYSAITQPDWAVVLPVVKGPRPMILTVTQFKAGAATVLTELPAGTAAWEGTGLTPEEVAVSRLKKETGYNPGRVIALPTDSDGYYIASGGSPTKFHPFLALDCEPTAGGPILTANEEIEYELIPLSEWLKMIMSGSISEPSAVVTTLRSLPHLGYKIV